MQRIYIHIKSILPIVVLIIVLAFVNHVHAQQTYKSYTFSHRNGKLVKKPITVDFLNDHQQIQHPFIKSLKVYRLDSVAFVEQIPELYEIYGTRIKLNYRIQKDSILLKENSPEYFAIFSAYHTIKALKYYKNKFGDLLDLPERDEFKNMKVYLGEFINCNPKEYVFNPSSRISPTTIYHETGHRAFCQLDDTIPVGDISTLLHNGLLEYFTASIANYPIVGEGFLPPLLTRNLSKPIRYPEDKYYYQDFMRDFYASYKDTLSYGTATEKLLELNLKRAEQCSTKILMTHQSGLLIAHPLWEIRQQIGKKVMDALVVKAIKELPATIKSRENYLQYEPENKSEKALWYDFLYGLYRADKKLFNGKHIDRITETFKKTGYDTKMVKTL
jgi:hypothetical protein